MMINSITFFSTEVLSTAAPAFLFLFDEQKGVEEIQIIGYLMAAGGELGVVGLKIAEKMENGLVHRRPNDMYFINVVLALVAISYHDSSLAIWWLVVSFRCFHDFGSSI